MDEKMATYVLSYVIEALDDVGCRYWLARGTFRHFFLTGSIGDQQSDIDFHLMAEDVPQIEEKLKQEMEKRQFTMHRRRPYKIAFEHTSTGIQVEFVLLFPCGEGLVYHQSRSRRLICDANLFGEKRMMMFGQNVRVPDEQYLEQIYGWDWDYVHPKTNK